MGLDRKCSYTKRIPAQILNGSKEVLRHFLGAYWTCDGSIEKKCEVVGRGRAWRVTATTVSEGLARDLMVALQRLGVRTRLRQKLSKIRTKKQGEVYKSWLLEVLGQDGVARVASLPGLCVRKQRSFVRNEFDRTLLADPITAIVSEEPSTCRCLTVDEDHSFTAAGFAVHNSLNCGVFWPAWLWTLDPTIQILCGSFDQTLLNGQSEKVLSILRSDRFRSAYPWVQLANSKSPALREFKLTAGGYRFNTSPEGKGLGRHADGALVDDPMKPQDAIGQRKAAFAKVNTWFDGTLQTRIRKWIVCVMQRVHTDDLAGRCLAEGYESLILPMRQTKRPMWIPPEWVRTKDPRTEPGELLWPDNPRFNEEGVRHLEIKLANEASAQLQQDPTPASGGIVEESWTRLEWIEPPERGTWVQSWDFSQKGTKEAHSRVSGQLWCATRELEMVRELLSTLNDRLARIPGAANDHIIRRLPSDRQVYDCLVDAVGGLWNFVTSKAQFVMAQDRAHWKRARVKLIEAKANGVPLIEEMKTRISGIIPVEPEGDKEMRLRAHTERFELGTVVFPPGKIGDEVREELIKFPRFTHDDHVDTATQALDRLGNKAAHFRENLRKAAAIPTTGR
jgi:predicted phage terminase large subunit-like protein